MDNNNAGCRPVWLRAAGSGSRSHLRLLSECRAAPPELLELSQKAALQLGAASAAGAGLLLPFNSLCCRVDVKALHAGSLCPLKERNARLSPRRQLAPGAVQAVPCAGASTLGLLQVRICECCWPDPRPPRLLLPGDPALPLAAAGAGVVGWRGGSVCRTGASALCAIAALCCLNGQVNPVSVSEGRDETGSTWLR